MTARILYVQQPDGGGSATGLYDLVRTLDRARYEPVVLFYQDNDYREAFSELGAEILVLGGTPTARPLPETVRSAVSALRRQRGAARQFSRLIRRDWPLARRIAGIIRTQDVDLVHNNDNPRGDRASMIAARLAGVPQVSHVRFLPRYYPPIDRWLARLVDYFIYMSVAIEEHYRSATKVPAERGKVVYDPFDFAAFGEHEEAGRLVRAELGLHSEHLVISNIGRLAPWKGQDVFLHAMRKVVSRFPRARALVVGAPAPKPAAEEYAARLRRLASELGLVDHVIFTGFRRDVPEIMSASDMIVHSASQPEPFGRVVVEAMAAARPVVATAAGGVLEIIEDGVTGRLVAPTDAGGMADSIIGLLSDLDTATRMGRQARQEAQRRFAPEHFAAELHQIYDRILG